MLRSRPASPNLTQMAEPDSATTVGKEDVKPILKRVRTTADGQCQCSAGLLVGGGR